MIRYLIARLQLLEAINTRLKSEWQDRYEQYKSKANAVGLT